MVEFISAKKFDLGEVVPEGQSIIQRLSLVESRVKKDLLTRSFLRHFRGKRLSAKTRVDRHHQQKINLVKKRLINRPSEFVKQS